MTSRDPREGLTRDEISRLRRLREGFLDTLDDAGASPAGDYWRDARDVELYDEFFGARIASKWNAVLDEVEARSPLASAEVVVDFGCGTGVAAASWLERARGASAKRVHLVDRSKVARKFAAARVRALRPHVEVVLALPPAGAQIDLLLASHVLPELDARGESELQDLARRSTSVVWIEPGDRATSRRLGMLRETLRETHALVAPCTHDATCGALAPGRENDWCHFFARPDADVFRSRAWRELAEALAIDLRSVPYSFLVLAKHGTHTPRHAPSDVRVLARGRAERGCVRFTACTAQGLSDLRFLERDGRETCRAIADPAGRALVFRMRAEGHRAHELEPLPPPADSPTSG